MSTNKTCYNCGFLWAKCRCENGPQISHPLDCDCHECMDAVNGYHFETVHMTYEDPIQDHPLGCTCNECRIDDDYYGELWEYEDMMDPFVEPCMDTEHLCVTDASGQRWHPQEYSEHLTRKQQEEEAQRLSEGDDEDEQVEELDNDELEHLYGF